MMAPHVRRVLEVLVVYTPLRDPREPSDALEDALEALVWEGLAEVGYDQDGEAWWFPTADGARRLGVPIH